MFFSGIHSGVWGGGAGSIVFPIVSVSPTGSRRNASASRGYAASSLNAMVGSQKQKL